MYFYQEEAADSFAVKPDMFVDTKSVVMETSSFWMNFFDEPFLEINQMLSP